MLGKVLVALEAVLVGVEDGQALVRQHLRLLQLRFGAGENPPKNLGLTAVPAFPEPGKGGVWIPYGVVGVPLEEFEVGVVQVLPAVDAFWGGGLRERGGGVSFAPSCSQNYPRF